MKSIMFGVAGVGGIGAVALSTGGGADDFTAVVSKPPAVVYAAFSELGPAGEIHFPTIDGWGARLKQRVVKVQDEQVKLEILVDEEALITAEVQLAPDGEGTRLAAELDLNQSLLTRIMREQGVPTIPTMAFEDMLVDHAFGTAMREAVDRIERGTPLMSIWETHQRWGSANGSGTFSYRSPNGTWREPAVRPQVVPRPALDPDAAARRFNYQ